MKRPCLLAFAISIAMRASASDHIDGPVTTAHRVADLSDLYAFPTPDRPGSLTIILNAYPLVPRDGHFAERVSYAILVRRASIQQSPGGRSFETGDEVALSCSFRTPHAAAEHAVTCRSSNGLGAQSRYEVVQGRDQGGDFRLYAGMRADPFFFNADFATDAIEGTLGRPDDSNVMQGVNVLAIVLEVDLSKLYTDPPAMVAVAAETTTRDSPGAPLRRLDRVGRPEITNVSLAARDEPDLRDRFNLERPFRAPAPEQRLYAGKLARNIAFFDALDGRLDWQARAHDELARLLAADFLVVDMSKPCPPQSFLEIEKAMLARRAHRTCGGRKPADDIMDTLFTLYVAGLGGKPVRDGVDRPAAPLSTSFPYLAPPDLSFWSAVKALAARAFLGIPDSQ
jgi:hypothetical protein